MKKSKIIAPALGVLLLSTAASVTGTVAWFTANRAATITSSTFKVANTESNMNVVLSNGINGTATTSGTTHTFTPTTSTVLRDASYDGEYMWRYSNYGDTSAALTKVTGTNWADGSVTISETAYNVVAAYQWKATVSLSNTTDGKTYALYFKKDSAVTSATAKFKPAYRTHIATTSAAGSVTKPALVWANSTDAQDKHVSTGGVADTAWETNVFQNNLASDVELGKITGTQTLVLTFTVWMEGCDAACVNESFDAETTISGAISATYGLRLAEVAAASSSAGA